MVQEYEVKFVSITDEMRAEAKPRAAFLATLNHHSAAGEDNYLNAAMAEKAMADYLGATFASTPDYDFYFKGADGNPILTMDNKNITTTVPFVKPHYDAQVFDYNKVQKPDVYTWSRVMRDMRRPDGRAASIFLVGWMKFDEFKAKMSQWEAGANRINPENQRNSAHLYDTKTNVVLVKDLHPLDELKRLGQTLINQGSKGVDQ